MGLKVADRNKQLGIAAVGARWKSVSLESGFLRYDVC